MAIRVVTLILVVGLGGLMFWIILLIKDLDRTLSLDPNLTLQEVLRSLELAAKLAARVGKDLEINLAESRQQFTRLVILLDRMQMDVTAGGEIGSRMEAADAQVAADLAESQERARSAAPPPGMAADAAASGGAPKKRTKKPPTNAP